MVGIGIEKTVSIFMFSWLIITVNGEPLRWLMTEDYIKRRDELGKFYKSKLWNKVRENALRRDNYLCCNCGRPAEVVHHIEHLSLANVNDPNISLNLNNLRSLCADCHFEEHRGEHCRGRINKENNPYTFDENGMLVPK